MDDKNTLTRTDDTIAPYSSRGPTVGGRSKPDLAAPGTNIISAAHNWEGSVPDYVAFSGTSMAAPHIAGAAALMRQMGIHSALAQKAILINSADLGSSSRWSEDHGYGYANLTSAKATSHATGVVAPSTRLYFATPDGAAPIKATLVWNRHMISGQSYLSDLDMTVFHTPTGELIGGAFGTENVEQSRESAGAKVIVVNPASIPDLVGTESFALAVNRSGLTAVTPPSLTLTCCAAPATVSLGDTFTLSWTVHNSGELEALDVRTQAEPPVGWSDPLSCHHVVSKLMGNTSVVRSCPVLAGAVGTVSIPVYALGLGGFGQDLDESATVNITVVSQASGASAITGFVRHAQPGQNPVFTVRLTGAATRSVQTDSRGRYVFAGLPPGSYTVTPTLTNWTFTPPNAVISLTSTAIAVADFTAHLTGISGTVLGLGDSILPVPMPGVRVVLAGTLSRTAITDSAGRYAFTGLTPGGNYTVTPTPTATQTFKPAKRVFNGLNSSVIASFEPAIKMLANNEPSSATEVRYSPATLAQDTAPATWNSTESLPSCTGQPGSRSVWFRLYADLVGNVLLNTFGTPYDTVLTVFEGSNLSGAELACNDDTAGLQSQVVLPVTVGQSYLVRVSGFSAATPGGRMVLNVIRP
jgi:hypothetical protein